MADTPTKVRDRTTAKASASPSASAGSTKPGATESPAADAKEKIKPDPEGYLRRWRERGSLARAMADAGSKAIPSSSGSPSPAAPATPADASAGPPATRTPVTPSFGPAGKHRSPLAVALLSVLTLGIHAMVWYHRINVEMADFDTRMHVRPSRSTLPIFIAWLLGWLVSLAGAARIVLAVLNVALPFDPGFTVTQAYFLLAGFLVLAFPFRFGALAIFSRACLPMEPVEPSMATCCFIIV